MPLLSASYLSLFIISLLIECSIILAAWKHRSKLGAGVLLSITLAQLLWITANVLEGYSSSIPTRRLWGMMQIFSLTINTTFVLAFVIQFIRLDRVLMKKRWLLLLLEPAITVGLTLTANSHQLLIEHGWAATNQTFMAATWEFAGPWLLVDLVYDVSLRFVALSLLVQNYGPATSSHRKRIWLSVLGILAPILYEVALVLNGNIGLESSLTVLVYAVGNAFLCLAFIYNNERDIVPVAERAIIQGLSDGVIVLNMANRVVDFNPAAARMLNQSMTDVIGKAATDVIFPGYAPPACAPTAEAAQLEITIPEAHGQLTYDLRISPLHDRHGHMSGRAVVLRDITERATLENALTVAKEHAESANLAKSEFLSIIGHELRTPLSVILLKCGLMERLGGQTMTQDQKNHLHTIEQNGRRLALLIDDMLDIARIENDRPLDLNFANVPIWSVVQESLKVVSPEADRKEITIAVTQDYAPGTIHGDASKLHKIIRHLLENAVKFTPKGGTVGLDIAHDNSQRQVSISVWDTGIGLEADKMAHLCQSFTQLNNGLARPYEGVGIGLALVKHLTDLHGGTISMESNGAKGSRFTISLPKAVPGI